MGSNPSTPAAPLASDVWRAPLVPIALAATVGIVLDRYAQVPLPLTLLASLVSLLAWTVTLFGKQTGLGFVYLSVAAAACGAAYHHWHLHIYAADDIGTFATAEQRPALIRGLLAEEPSVLSQVKDDPLRSIQRADPTLAVVEVTQFHWHGDWIPVSGRVQLRVAGQLQGFHVGDEIEVVGRLQRPHPPGNPGETDYAAVLRDQRIRAQFHVEKTTDGVTRLARRWPWSLAGWLAVVRSWGQRVLLESLPPETGKIAVALLLGDGSPMTHEDWQKYIRTGVIHVLAISGQHLAVLAVFLWWFVRLTGVRRRRAAWFVALFLIGYSLLAGGRPPVMRSAVTVGVFCLGLILRRQVLPANSFALAWLVVALLNPTDIFDAGCQLSFVSVALLYWGPKPLSAETVDPLQKLEEESRPFWQRQLFWLTRQIGLAYLLTFIIWFGLAPLVGSHYHMISFVGLLLGPPLVLLSSVALVGGFLLLAVAEPLPFLRPLLALPVHWSLAGSDFLVDCADRLPGGYGYLGLVPAWWIAVFYPALFAGLTVPPLRRHWRWLTLAGLGWLCIGLLVSTWRLPQDELRCTFLAVGHGGCTVLEAPDGRVLLYDAGALTGPEVTRRQIAPFLWSRGCRRIDEVFLSHADLDHFNGLPALLERFAVGQVTCTPTFADKTTQGVRETLAKLAQYKIPIRIVHAGDRLTAGAVELEVLHPPEVGPEGNENARSLVLLIRHAGHSILLTGDLEGAGLDRVLSLPSLSLDILMAPHHGSRFPNTPELAAWARPRVVVSCEGPPHGPIRPPEPYTARGAVFLGTWPHGAVTIRSHESGLLVETFTTTQRFVAQRGGPSAGSRLQPP
jgi:competence protein ComEC